MANDGDFHLPPGVTGFLSAGEAPLSSDPANFGAWVHRISRVLQADVQRVDFGSAVVNFDAFKLSMPTGVSKWALRNRHLPLVGFTEVMPTLGMKAGFVEPPTCDACGDYGLVVLSAEQLNGPLRQADLDHLGPTELAQIRYWKPSTLGEVVFNFWD